LCVVLAAAICEGAVDLLAGEELPMLRTFYEAFEKRESARIGEGFYPEGIKALSRQCIEA
jgi:hypothetical protein